MRDGCFIGRDKGRLKYIIDLEDKFKESGLSTNIKIINKEKDFIYEYPLWRFMSYDSGDDTKTTININPSFSTKGFLIDSFCEKPAYVPIKNRREDLESYNTAKKYSLYFPLSDKLEGYNLYDA